MILALAPFDYRTRGHREGTCTFPDWTWNAFGCMHFGAHLKIGLAPLIDREFIFLSRGAHYELLECASMIYSPYIYLCVRSLTRRDFDERCQVFEGYQSSHFAIGCEKGSFILGFWHFFKCTFYFFLLQWKLNAINCQMDGCVSNRKLAKN